MSTEQKSTEQKKTATSTKDRLGTIPRQATVAPAPVPAKRKDGPARAAKAVIGLCTTATLGALVAAGLAGVGAGAATIGAYGSLANPAETARVAGFPMTSGSLQLDGLYLRPEGFTNNFDGVAAITWAGAEAVDGQSFSITIRKGENAVGTLTGSLANLEPGATTTVNVSSTSDFVSGPLSFELGTNVPTLNQEGTLNLLNGMTMLDAMRADAEGAIYDARKANSSFAGIEQLMNPRVD
ncbi:MAG: hypothetical protein ACT4QF_08420 [Sporichthyaceae bacterium]|jgi:hypothetical protein